MTISTAEAAPKPAAGREFNLREALEELVRRGGSDLHLKVGRPPVVRVNGDLQETPLAVLRPEDIKRCAEQTLSPKQREVFAERKEIDFAIGVQGLGRFRTNIFQQRGTLGMAFRAIPVDVPSLETLELPAALEEIAQLPRGLVLVTGITGSGKSTTLAAMIRKLNEQRAVNIVTIEDPIEFLHRDIKSMISQREVGADTLSFHDALRHVLRQDPDVIMLGEIRDRPSMETVLKAADTGHMVMSTLHTTDAAQTINRIISFFPPHQHAEIRQVLANALKAIVSLRLIPRADKPGRVPAAEVLVNTATISELIRKGDDLVTIPDHIAEGRVQYGMQTFDQSLLELYSKGWISYAWAMHYASNPSEFALRVSGVSPGEQEVWQGAPETLK
ncbi:type IV pilus twitching motility protein PilT [Longimicrobium sp.]|uniref:type IV pilus twitching motility protein PilT n=1 Tax=Longimicrobium sp. TaxID=2029185 RepID=UPI002BF27FDB|nr:type IV pilus twitching motility protein PilT [Longimicrobium sp.]HSU15735.1 type IV pilus twitching motility protein PilT [Longimicrobium sp.]